MRIVAMVALLVVMASGAASACAVGREVGDWFDGGRLDTKVDVCANITVEGNIRAACEGRADSDVCINTIKYYVSEGLVIDDTYWCREHPEECAMAIEPGAGEEEYDER